MLTPPRGKVNGRIFQHNQIANCGGEEIRTRTDEGAENIVNGGESAPGNPMLTPPRGKVNGRIFQHNQIANCGEEEIRTMTDEGAENVVNGGESAPGNPMLNPSTLSWCSNLMPRVDW